MALVLPLLRLDSGSEFDYAAWKRIGRTGEVISQARILTRIAALGPFPPANRMRKIYVAAIFRNGATLVETFARIFEDAETAIVEVDSNPKMIDNLPT